MSAQHTPGPWFVQRHQESSTRAITTTPGSAKGDIANVWAGLGSKDVEADARLIAAAPDLLAALIEAKEQYAALLADSLQKSHKHLVEQSPVLVAASAAIAKATGSAS